MVTITLNDIIFNNQNDLFTTNNVLKSNSIKSKKLNTKLKKIKKKKITEGGLFGFNFGWLKIKEEHLSNDNKTKIIVSNNGIDDTIELYNNGKIIKTVEVNSLKIKNIHDIVLESIKDFYQKNKNNSIQGGYNNQVYPVLPSEIQINNNTHLFQTIYKKRSIFGMIGTFLLNFFFFCTFTILYLLLAGTYILATKDIPFDFYHNYIIINGQEVRV
jgi:hypothetical protein